MKNILLPTDFSENAYNAIVYAGQLFKNEKCIFHLLNCYTPDYYDSDFISYSPTSTISLIDVHKKNSIKSLGNIKKRIANEFPNELHSYKFIPSYHTLAEELPYQAQIIQPDAIIMGTQGATGAKQILFGSHTVHAFKKTSIPLMAIPSGYKFKIPGRILFPTDFDINYTKDHLRLLRQLAKMFGSTIDILHVYFETLSEEICKKGENYLAQYFEEIPHTFRYINKPTITEGISTFQVEHAINLLVMISNKHSYLENLLFRPVTNEIGFKITTPFLVIPSGKFNK